MAIRTRFVGTAASWPVGAKEHFDEPVLCSEVLDHAELREDSDAWLSDLLTQSGWFASRSQSAPCLRLPFAVFGKKHSSGRRMSAMPPRTTPSVFGNKIVHRLSGTRSTVGTSCKNVYCGAVI